MIVITRIVRNDKKEIAFVEPYCVFDGDMKEDGEVCSKLTNNDVSWDEYIATNVEVCNAGDFL